MPLAKRKIHAYALAVGAALVYYGKPVHANVFQSHDGYAVSIPNGWLTQQKTVSPKDRPSIDKLITHPKKGLPIIFIDSDQHQTSASLKTAAFTQSYLNVHYPGFEVVEQRSRDVDETHAVEIAISGRHNGATVVLETISVVEHSKLYTIMMFTTSDNLTRDGAYFESLLRSFRWTKV